MLRPEYCFLRIRHTCDIYIPRKFFLRTYICIKCRSNNTHFTILQNRSGGSSSQASVQNQRPAGSNQPMSFMALAKALAPGSSAPQPAPQPAPQRLPQHPLPQPQAQPIRVPANLNVASSSEAVPIDNGDSDDEYAQDDDDSDLGMTNFGDDHFIIKLSYF